MFMFFLHYFRLCLLKKRGLNKSGVFNGHGVSALAALHKKIFDNLYVYHLNFKHYEKI